LTHCTSCSSTTKRHTLKSQHKPWVVLPRNTYLPTLATPTPVPPPRCCNSNNRANLTTTSKLLSSITLQASHKALPVILCKTTTWMTWIWIWMTRAPHLLYKIPTRAINSNLNHSLADSKPERHRSTSAWPAPSKTLNKSTMCQRQPHHNPARTCNLAASTRLSHL